MTISTHLMLLGLAGKHHGGTLKYIEALKRNLDNDQKRPQKVNPILLELGKPNLARFSIK